MVVCDVKSVSEEGEMEFCHDTDLSMYMIVLVFMSYKVLNNYYLVC